VTEAHARPFDAEEIAREFAKDLADPLGAVPYLRSMKGEAPRATPQMAAKLLAAATLEDEVAAIAEVLEAARAERDKAFAKLSREECDHIRDHIGDLSQRLAFTVAIDDDNVPAREAANRRTMDLLKRVDVRAIGEALRLALVTVEPAVLKHLAQLAAAHPKHADALILAKDTPAGRIEIGGTAATTYTTEVAYRFDLGGDDRYLDVGGAAGFDRPIAITVDWEGDDVYLATSEGRQGAGIGGIGILVDCAGNDRYVGTRLCQGVGIAGAGLLVDLAGDDSYDVQDCGQGLGLRGLGYLRDAAGNDRYRAARLAQGVGLPGGIGVLRDEAGDDHYSLWGRDLSNYQTKGVFDGWGQGAGIGFRGIASGGIGLLHDLGAGRDVYEGGNFAQGGGYFFGLGILVDEGGDDRYFGARYAQGWAAHQAVGVFIEKGGNDRYEAVDAAAAGISWDESVAVFHDEAGDDRYEMQGFVLGAAAETAIAIFLDDKGADTYTQTPAIATDNSYHGGTSVALAIDGAGKDRYLDGKGADDRAGWRGERAYFLDGVKAKESAAGVIKKGNVFGK
jgi:hypothetical protein